MPSQHHQPHTTKQQLGSSVASSAAGTSPTSHVNPDAPPPPPTTHGGNPVPDQDELLTAKATQQAQGNYQQSAPGLGPEITGGASDQYPGGGNQYQNDPSRGLGPGPGGSSGVPAQTSRALGGGGQQYGEGVGSGGGPLTGAAGGHAHHHRDDAVISTNPNAPLAGGPGAGGPHISTQDKVEGNVHPPSYDNNEGFTLRANH
jgi:hypothetical protein